MASDGCSLRRESPSAESFWPRWRRSRRRRPILRWYRDQVAAKYDGSRTRGGTGRPATRGDKVKQLLTMARENPSWGYTRLRGALDHGGLRHPQQVWLLNRCARPVAFACCPMGADPGTRSTMRCLRASRATPTAKPTRRASDCRIGPTSAAASGPSSQDRQTDRVCLQRRPQRADPIARARRHDRFARRRCVHGI
jgi:hypothetical protein